VYLCYIDESGTPDVPGNTSHFILCRISIPIWLWTKCESDINEIKNRYQLQNSEIHTGWLLRPYSEQKKIPNFETLNYTQRKYEVEKLRNTYLLYLQTNRKKELLKQTKKNFKQTAPYIHLSYNERRRFMEDIAKKIGSWGFARLFAECIDKIHFDPARTDKQIGEQAFEQLVSRYEKYLQVINTGLEKKVFGVMIHDNNPTVEKKHTELMKSFRNKGTLWTDIQYLIETPLFVNSALTSMIQIADVCAYSLRRYLENKEEKLFKPIFLRADRKDGVAVGVRHFSQTSCSCLICSEHKQLPLIP